MPGSINVDHATGR